VSTASCYQQEEGISHYPSAQPSRKGFGSANSRHWKGRLLCFCCLLSTVVCPLDSWAFNGKVAVIGPVSGITVDGDFSDWPEGLTKHRIEIPLEEYSSPTDTTDLQAWFTTGYNPEEGPLYVAVEAVDHAEVVEPDGVTLYNDTDGVEVYVDFSSSGDHPYSVQTIGREIREFEMRYIHLERTETRVGVVRDRGRQRYEVRIDADVVSETGAIVAGQWLPFDRVEMETLGEAGASPIAGIRMSLQSRDQKMPWTPLQSGTAGRLTLDLPEGAYEVRPESRSKTASDLVLFDTRELSGVLPVQFKQPVSTPAQLGSGTGHWRYFDSADGLPDDRAYNIAQDSAGNIWISQKQSGLTRYDGSAFRTYTEADGLLSTHSEDLVAFGDGIWVANRGGVTFVSSSDTVAPRAFEIPHGERPARVRALSIDPGGTLYASTSEGILSRPADPDSRDTMWTMIDSIDTYGTNAVVHNGSVRFGLIFRSVYETSEQGHVQSSREPDAGRMVRDLANVRGVRRLTVGPEGDLWIVSPRDGLVRYGSNSQVDFYRTNRAGNYRQLTFDSGGALWAITAGDLYTLEGERLRHVPTHPFGVSNAQVAVALSFDFDGETSWLYRGERSPASMSRGAYGARVGVPRILDLLDRYDVPASFFVPAVNGQLHPGAIDDILSRDRHEIGVHGWIHERAQEMTEEQQRELLSKSFSFWHKRTGYAPAGIRTPSWDFTEHTLGIIRDLGFVYDSSLIGDDRPYELCVDGEPTGVVELPVEWLLDDHPYLQIDPTRGSRSYIHPNAVLEIWREEFNVALEERTLFLLTMHPQVIGHRSRLKMLERLIKEIQQTSGVWWATHEDVAKCVLGNGSGEAD